MPDTGNILDANTVRVLPGEGDKGGLPDPGAKELRSIPCKRGEPVIVTRSATREMGAVQERSQTAQKHADPALLRSIS